MDRREDALAGSLVPRRVAIVGGGWAGLAAAIRARMAGHDVVLFETSRLWGGRARSAGVGAETLDNGQHILIGAYARTLTLMRDIGVDHTTVLMRMPLTLCNPQGVGLRLRPGSPLLALAGAVFGHRGWTWRDRVSLLQAASRWARAGFTCPPDMTVEVLSRNVSVAVRRELIEPLCVAALNTPASTASAQVFLRVLRDALFSGPGSADLLLPKVPLDQLFPGPAADWLRRNGVTLRTGHRVRSIVKTPSRWRVDDDTFDGVVVACTAVEAARLVQPVDASWSDRARSLAYEPIVTVYLGSPGSTLPVPMVALSDGPADPAQFAFDHGAMGGIAGRFAFVASGAAPWVEAGHQKTADAMLDQARRAFPAGTWKSPPSIEAIRTERRATFRCVPGLLRPACWIAPGLVAAGDYIDGPYPSTLEGAVRSGELAVSLVGRS